GVLDGWPDNGAVVRPYQFPPHDNWDYDANAEMILADLPVGGEERNVLVHFDKNGFAYTLDRATGEVLVAEPFVTVSWAKRVDRSSGRPVVDSTKLTGASRGNVKDICPSLEGGKTPAAPAAYSARTGLFYVPTNNLCMDYQAVTATRIAGTPFIGANTPYHAGPDGKQYVAVYAGIGGDWFLLAGDVRSDDPADVRPPADFIRDIARHTSQGGMVWLFGLGP